jgi:hypothetical protein
VDCPDPAAVTDGLSQRPVAKPGGFCLRHWSWLCGRGQGQCQQQTAPEPTPEEIEELAARVAALKPSDMVVTGGPESGGEVDLRPVLVQRERELKAALQRAHQAEQELTTEQDGGVRAAAYRIARAAETEADTLRAEMADLLTGRDGVESELLERLRTRYPTEWAYQQACRALDKHRDRATRAEATLAAFREQRTDPGLLRWCGWPGCLASYNAVTGPTDRGWIRPTSPDTLLCPDHANRGHRPGYDRQRSTEGHVVGRCSCGASQQVTPANLGGVSEWWVTHVAALDTTSHTDNTAPPAQQPVHAAVFQVIRQYPPRAQDDYGQTVENARVWRAVEAALAAETLAEKEEARAQRRRAATAETALAAERAGLPEWHCPSCGAVTRARMADHQNEADLTRVGELLDRAEAAALKAVGPMGATADEAMRLIGVADGIRTALHLMQGDLALDATQDVDTTRAALIEQLKAAGDPHRDATPEDPLYRIRTHTFNAVTNVLTGHHRDLDYDTRDALSRAALTAIAEWLTEETRRG